MQFYQDFELKTKSNQDIDSDSTFKIPSNAEIQALIGKDLQKGDEITKVTTVGFFQCIVVKRQSVGR